MKVSLIGGPCDGHTRDIGFRHRLGDVILVPTFPGRAPVEGVWESMAVCHHYRFTAVTGDTAQATYAKSDAPIAAKHLESHA